MFSLGMASHLLAQPVNETDGVTQVCAKGPDARIARAQRLEGTAQRTAANVLPNPSFVVEHQRAVNGVTDSQTVVGISMPLAIGGPRSKLRAAAAARSEQAQSEADATLFESALAFRQAYAGAVLSRARVAALTDQQAKLEALSATIAALAQGGEVASYDLQRQRVQAQLHQRTLESWKARADASLVWLEAWLGSDVELSEVNLFELAGGSLGDGLAVDGASPRHPVLRGLDAHAKASALEAEAANRRWVPGLEVFAGYRGTSMADDAGHGIALALRVPLTFFDHGQGEAALASAERERAVAESESLLWKHRAGVRSLDAQLEQLRASAVKFAGVAAEAEAMQSNAQQLYTAGEATLTELLEAFRASEEAQLALIDLAQEIAMARLERMRAAGTQLDTTVDRACSATHGSAQ